MRMGHGWSRVTSSSSPTVTPPCARARSSPRCATSSSAAPRGDQGRVAGAALAAEGDPADEQAHVRQRLQESAERPRSRAADRGLRAEGPPAGGAQISPRHANFIENAGGATSADAVALMGEARRRVHDRSRSRSSTRSDSWARSSCRRCRETARRGELQPRGRPQARNCARRRASRSRGRLRRSPAAAVDRRSASASRCSRSAPAPTRRARDLGLRRPQARDRRRDAAGAGGSARRAHARARPEPASASTARTSPAATAAIPDVISVASIGRSRTRSGSRSRPSAR